MTSDRAVLAIRTLARLSASVSCLVADDAAVVRRMREAQAGLRAHPADAGRASTGTHSDPTAADALRRVDRASRDLRRLDDVLERLVRCVTQLDGLIDSYPAPFVPEDATHLAAENGPQEPACENCARIPGPRGGRRWEPVDSRLHQATRAANRLPEPMWLCVWCYEKLLHWDRLPTVEELERHHSGQRVPWPPDIPRPPDRTSPAYDYLMP